MSREPRLDLRTLQVYCDVIETRSFSRSAERNFISQSAASQRIRALERDAAQPLLERSRGRGRIHPTGAGQVLYTGAKALLSAAQELEERLQGLVAEVSGTVRVATVYSVGLHALPGRLKPFLAACPGVKVQLEYSQTGKVYQDVRSGRVDVGIVACPDERTDVEVIPFGSDDMVLICAPEDALSRRRDVSLQDLADRPFVAFADGIPTRRLTDARLAGAGITVSIVAAMDNIETLKNLVEIGSGVALVPHGTVKQEESGGTLAVVPLVPADAFRRPTGMLLKRSGARRAAVRAFVEAMRRQS